MPPHATFRCQDRQGGDLAWDGCVFETQWLDAIGRVAALHWQTRGNY